MSSHLHFIGVTVLRLQFSLLMNKEGLGSALILPLWLIFVMEMSLIICMCTPMPHSHAFGQGRDGGVVHPLILIPTSSSSL